MKPCIGCTPTTDSTWAPHLSCVGGTRAELGALLDDYRAAGYRRIVALRGDLPSGMATPGDFRYASELVRFIREHSGDHIHIEVAAYPEMHPQADDALADLRHFKAKVDAGADGAITQYFFNADAYFRFVDDVRRLGVKVPIVPGIMPISNYSQLKRFSDGCGAEIPRWIAKRMLGPWRRCRLDPRAGRRRGRANVSPLARRRCAVLAFLYLEPRTRHARDPRPAARISNDIGRKLDG